ncbi:MAG: flagellar basal body P-ring formation chaperone FlgA [Deltaproteobacteria bacterium]
MNTHSLKSKMPKRLYTGLVFILIAASLWVWPAASGAAQTAVVRVHDRVEIDGDDVLLGQIAAIEGSDARWIQQLRDIVIGRAPLPGQTRRYDRHYLEMRLKQHDVDLSAVVLAVPQNVEVARSAVIIEEQELRQMVSDFILRNISRDNKTFRIKEIRVPKGVILPKGRVSYRVVAPRSRELMGKCPIAVDLSVNGQPQKKVWTTATIEILGPVVMTCKPLGRHKPITEDDIELQTMDLSDLPRDVIADPAAVLGKRTRRAIGAQTPLRADLIELPPLVKRGDLVTVIAESNGLKITTLGQVKKKGRLGERIPVVNMDSKKILYARVVDANTVKVDF